METKVLRYLLGILYLWLVSCSDDPVLPQELVREGTAREKLLMQEWQLETLIVEDIDTMKSIARFFEPLCGGRDPRSASMVYTGDYAYQLRWDPTVDRPFSLGINENWQPNFGYWQLSENEDSLIHNFAQYYQTNYKIDVLTEDSFIRTSSRVIYFPFEECTLLDTLYDTGEIVKFTEVFVRKVD